MTNSKTRSFINLIMPTEPQIARLYAIANSHGWTHEGVKRLLESNYKVKSSRELSRKQYDEVCEFLEKSTNADVVTMNHDPNTLDMFSSE